jgi:RNA polymerase sigma factor (sigma-70 family)
VTDDGDAEEILQEVFYELVETYRLMKPIEQVSAWLFRVARNRITDLFRKKKPVAFSEVPAAVSEDGEALRLEDLLPSPDAGPDAVYARSVLIEELDAALEELPAEQREAFVAHEIEGRSFKLAAETGLSVNALVLRKHYAVEHLRKRLAAVHEEFAESQMLLARLTGACPTLLVSTFVSAVGTLCTALGTLSRKDVWQI